MTSTELQSIEYAHVFQQGKLYQVYARKKWIIAEYLKMVPGHTERYHNLNMNTFQVGSEQVRSIPCSHYWKAVVGGSMYCTVAKDTQTRPVTDETLTEITRLKGELKQNDLNRVALLDELKDLTL